MKEETTKEKIAGYITNFIYRIVKPIYLKSVGCETLDDYIGELLMVELIYSDGSFVKDILNAYKEQSEWYWKENQEGKKKLENLILAIDELKK